MSHHSTFVFADIAGFTALTEAHGDDDAADLAVDFAQRVRDRLAADGGEVVKTIGDAVMIRMDTPASAITLGLEIVEGLMAGHGEPTVRVGMHTGAASKRGGDYFGASVNLAARIAAFAGGGQVVLSAAVRDGGATLQGVRFLALGHQRLRNAHELVHLYAAIRDSTEARLTQMLDPVCRMAIAPGREVSRVVHADTEYLFCSASCADRFAADPEAYTLRHLKL